jgi:serine/threonine protein kinase
VKLLDFGIARVATEAAETEDRLAPFTPAYAAPEQFSTDHGAIGPWTDVFALALVAAELAAGRRIMQGNNILKLRAEACERERRLALRRAGVDLGPEVEAVFERALAVNPADRFQGAAELWEALTRAAYGSPSPHELRSPAGAAPRERLSEPSTRPDPEATVLVAEVTGGDPTRRSP